MKEVATKIIRKNLNICIESVKYHSIKALKQLSNNDIAVFTININETKKLLNNNRLTLVLESDVRMITRIYGIMINRLGVLEFDIGEKEKIIWYIKKKGIKILRDYKELILSR